MAHSFEGQVEALAAYIGGLGMEVHQAPIQKLQDHPSIESLVGPAHLSILLDDLGGCPKARNIHCHLGTCLAKKGGWLHRNFLASRNPLNLR